MKNEQPPLGHTLTDLFGLQNQIDAWHQTIPALMELSAANKGYLARYILLEVLEALAEVSVGELEGEPEPNAMQRQKQELFDVLVMLRQYQRQFYPATSFLAGLDNKVSNNGVGARPDFYDLLQGAVLDLIEGDKAAIPLIASLVISRLRALEALDELPEIGARVLAGNHANRPPAAYQVPVHLQVKNVAQAELQLIEVANWANNPLRLLRDVFGQPLPLWVPIVFADYIYYRPDLPPPQIPLLEAIEIFKGELIRWSLKKVAGAHIESSSYHELFQRSLQTGLIGPQCLETGLVLAGGLELTSGALAGSTTMVNKSVSSPMAFMR